MSDETYNGYPNWATYFVCSLFDNIETPHHKIRDLAVDHTSADVQEYVEALLFGTPDADLHPSELNTLRYSREKISREEFDGIDWKEVQEHFRDE